MSEYQGPSPQELRNNTPDLNVEMLPRGAQATLQLASLDGARETAHMTVIAPRRRLLYEPGMYYSPMQVAFTRQTDTSELQLSILGSGGIIDTATSKKFNTLRACNTEIGSLKRLTTVNPGDVTIEIPYKSVTATSPDGQPLSAEALGRPELQTNESFNQVDQFHQQTVTTIRNQHDSQSVMCADGTHQAIVSDDSTIDIWNKQRSVYKIRKVRGDAPGEVHYVAERRQRHERPGQQPLVMTINTVISNNPEYHNTQYITYANLLKDDYDPHDCTVEIPPRGTPQAIARLSPDQALADSGAIDTAAHTFTIAGQTIPIPEQPPEDIETFIRLTQSKAPEPQAPATSLVGRFMGLFGRKS